MSYIIFFSNFLKREGAISWVERQSWSAREIEASQAASTR
jgi:hypothetical protein